VRSRKKEVELLIEVLEQAHDSVEDLAESVWKLLDSQRRGREAWVVAVNHGYPLVLTYGMYETMNAALKDLEKYRSTTGNEKAYVLKLLSSSAMFGGDEIDYK
jgi:hypothetical protein